MFENLIKKIQKDLLAALKNFAAKYGIESARIPYDIQLSFQLTKNGNLEYYIYVFDAEKNMITKRESVSLAVLLNLKRDFLGTIPMTAMVIKTFLKKKANAFSVDKTEVIGFIMQDEDNDQRLIMAISDMEQINSVVLTPEQLFTEENVEMPETEQA